MTTAARLFIRLQPGWAERRRRAELHRALRDDIYDDRRARRLGERNGEVGICSDTTPFVH